MSEKHTPGPWVVKGEPSDLLCVVDHDSRYIVDRFKLGGRGIEEHLANARLIAAAPELLTALKQAAPYLYNVPLEGALEAWEIARTAIAKAEGR